MKLVGHIALQNFVHPFVTRFCACHILRTMYARVLKLYIPVGIPYEKKIDDP